MNANVSGMVNSCGFFAGILVAAVVVGVVCLIRELNPSRKKWPPASVEYWDRLNTRAALLGPDPDAIRFWHTAKGYADAMSDLGYQRKEVPALPDSH